jgi:hypothetical protein
MVTAFIIRKLPLDKQVEIGGKGNLPGYCSENGASVHRQTAEPKPAKLLAEWCVSGY